MEWMMSEEQTGKPKPTDPTEMFRGMRDAYLDLMSKAMVEVVNTEGYAEATGAVLNNSLAVTAPFREVMEKSMLQVLQQLSLPSRQDIVALAERFTNLEMRLDDMDAKLDRIGKQTHAARPAGPAEPASPRPKAQPEMQAEAKAPATRKRVAAVKQVPPRKRAAKKATK
jgi:polyhydroxyalkanoate synthesis regulator phasin